MDKEIPDIVSNNLEKCLIDELSSIGFTFDDDVIDWNQLFYAIHHGGSLVLSKVEEKLGLREDQ